MPYYHWQGVRLDASYCKGTFFARDPDALSRRLFAQEVALLSYSVKKNIYLLPISSEQKYLFFQHLHALLAAGIHIWQALIIISEQTADPRFAEITLRLADMVQEGHALHEGFARHHIFTSEMIHVTQIGAEADSLPVALHMLCDHLESVEQFKKKMRSVLLLPLCTFGIFIIIMLVVLLVVIPKYAQLFTSMSKELPGMTRMLMRISDFISSYYMLGTLFILVTVITVVLRVIKTPAVKQHIDEHIVKLRFIGPLVKHIELVHCLRSLALLLQGGMPLVPALSIAQEAVSNSLIKQVLGDVIEQVRSGFDLSHAMQNKPELFSQDIIMLVTVGQETGYLQDMISRAAMLYDQRVQKTLQRFTFIVQPVLMLILGLLVAALICAVYMPLFNLADLG
jgi:type II secretory pathway component PulF